MTTVPELQVDVAWLLDCNPLDTVVNPDPQRQVVDVIVKQSVLDECELDRDAVECRIEQRTPSEVIINFMVDDDR